MALPYPYPTNITGLDSMFGYATTVSEGWMPKLFVFSFPIIIFLILNTSTNIKKSYNFTISFFLTTFLGSFIWAGGYIDGRFIVIPLLLTVLCSIWAYLDS